MNLKKTYDKIAPDWHKDHQSDDWWIAGTDKFVSFLRSGDLILDVGCGGGTKSKYLLEKGLKIVGLDFSEKLIGIAKKEVPGVDFIVMDMRDARKLKQNFEGIFAQASFLHITKNDLVNTLHALASKLNRGGYFYAAVKEIQPNGPEEEIKKENDYGYPYRRFFSYYSMGELSRYFKNLNLEIVYKNIKKAGKSNWLQIIGKKK